MDTDERGLLPNRQAALRVAARANTRGDTKPVTWFPGVLIEWDTPIQSGLSPDTTEAPAPLHSSPGRAGSSIDQRLMGFSSRT
ncbi:hypothetical protein DEJ44_28935 [Streptomyces venezuelae]|nr:hypothetical protein DEJ44_28935 [Streptomyces venezuelae]